MPKIVREDDDFSSFIWKDLSRETLAFVHAHYFSDEMTVDDYIKTYYSNKIRHFKDEADRLFEEAKETCLVAGTFPVYYCYAYASCERGTNENHNRMIRRFLPKGMKKTTHEFVAFIEQWINNYPRRMFNYKSSIQIEK